VTPFFQYTKLYRPTRTRRQLTFIRQRQPGKISVELRDQIVG